MSVAEVILVVVVVVVVVVVEGQFIPRRPQAGLSPPTPAAAGFTQRTQGKTVVMMKSEESEHSTETWEGEFDPLADPEERRVLFTALDSFRCV